MQYGASVLIFDPDGRLLLVKHRLRGAWEWPAGGGKLGEPPHVAAVREAGEEVHIVLTAPKLVGVYVNAAKWLPARFNFAFTETVTAAAAAGARYDRLELTAMRWVDTEEALRVISPRLRWRLERLLEARAAGVVAYLSNEQAP